MLRDIKKTIFIIGLCALIMGLFVMPLDTVYGVNESNEEMTSAFELGIKEYKSSKPLTLKGYWLYYPNVRIVPSDFNNRTINIVPQLVELPEDLYSPNAFKQKYGGEYGTLRCELSLAPEYLGKPMTLRSTQFYKKATVYVNGIAYMTPDKTTDFYSIRSKLTPQILANFTPRSTKVEIVIHFSVKDNLAKHYGQIVVGLTDQVHTDFIVKLMLDIFVFSTLIVLGIFNFAFYIRQNRLKNRDRIGLYFAFVILLMALRIMNSGEHYILYLLPDIPGEVFTKLAYWSYYLTVPMLLVFVSEVKSEIFPKYIQKSGIYASLVFGLFVMMVGYEIYAKLIYFYYLYVAAAFFYVGLYFTRAMRRNKNGGWADLISLGLVLITFLADSLSINGVGGLRYFYVVGVFTFVLYNTLLLSRAYASAIDKIEDLFVEYNRQSEQLYNLENGIDHAIEVHTESLNRQLADKISRLAGTEQIATMISGGLIILDYQMRITAVYGNGIERIFGSDLIGKKLTRVLFAHEVMEGQLFEDILMRCSTIQSEKRLETYMSLLPTEVSLHGSELKIVTSRLKLNEGYSATFSVYFEEVTSQKVLKRDLEMVLSETVLLESFIKYEDEILYLHQWQTRFFDLELKQLMKACKSKEELIERILAVMDRLAIWHQAFGFKRTAENIKHFTQELSHLYLKVDQMTLEDVVEIIENTDVRRFDDEDFRILKDRLGIKKVRLDLTESELENGKKDLLDFLEVFEPYCKVVSERYGKLLMPIEISGESIEVSKWRTGSFVRSLARIFDAMIVYSLEYYDERIRHGKTTNGQIRVHIERDDTLIRFILSDDGQGIQINALKDAMFKLNIMNFKELVETSEADIFQYIFLKGILYRDMDAGRANIGNELYKVKEAVDALHGSIKIDHEYKTGTRYVIEIPIKELIG